VNGTDQRWADQLNTLGARAPRTCAYHFLRRLSGKRCDRPDGDLGSRAIARLGRRTKNPASAEPGGASQVSRWKSPLEGGHKVDVIRPRAMREIG
jgi:hypothetical protein